MLKTCRSGRHEYDTELRRCPECARNYQREYMLEYRANMTPEQLERNRERGRVANMTPEQIERRRERQSRANMTPEQLERAHERERLRLREYRANMTPEQLERERERMREYEETRIRVRIGGLRWSYRVRPEKKDALRQALTDYRAAQQIEYEEVANVGLN